MHVAFIEEVRVGSVPFVPLEKVQYALVVAGQIEIKGEGSALDRIPAPPSMLLWGHFLGAGCSMLTRLPSVSINDE